MLTTRFGIEVELTGITRKQAAKTAECYIWFYPSSSSLNGGGIKKWKDEVMNDDPNY